MKPSSIIHFKAFIESLKIEDTALLESVRKGFSICFESTYELKSKKGTLIKTTIPPFKRTLDNIPKYADGRDRVKFQDWLEMDPISNSTGLGCDGKWYGWSHRAIYGFKAGDHVKAKDVCYDGKDFIIKDEDDARRQAEKFAKSVS